jgi:ankyrin repeat protein
MDNGNTFLLWASINGNVEIIQLSLSINSIDVIINYY